MTFTCAVQRVLKQAYKLLADVEQLVIWDKARAETTLWFAYAAERATDPVIEAMPGGRALLWDSDQAQPACGCAIKVLARLRGRRVGTGESA